MFSTVRLYTGHKYPFKGYKSLRQAPRHFSLTRAPINIRIRAPCKGGFIGYGSESIALAPESPVLEAGTSPYQRVLLPHLPTTS
ncbi:hypothetical protein RSAG8_07627, partial [Rhizoctonia solani AG-8 WAC10335]